MITEIQQVAEIINSLGENAKSAFIWYLSVSLAKTVVATAGLTTVGVIIGRAFSRMVIEALK